MSTAHDESSGSPSGSGTNPPGGLQSYPEQLTLRASGWQSPIGTVRGLRLARIEKKAEEKALAWYKLHIDELVLSRPAALLVIQGMPLKNLFPPDCAFCFENTMNPVVNFDAPIVLLNREVRLLSNPPKLTHVALGVVLFSRGYTEDEILSEMISRVQSG